MVLFPHTRAVLSAISVLLVAACTSATNDPLPASHSQQNRYDTVAIVSAMQVEQRELLEWATNRRSEFVRGVSFQIGELAGMECVFLVTGVGLETAARTTEVLFEEFDVDAILFSGVAGGINPDLRICDVSAASRWARHDTGDDAPVWYEADGDLLDLAGRLVSQVGLNQCVEPGDCLEYRPGVVVGGNGVTGAHFIAGTQERVRILTEFGAQSVDMETSEIARVASRYQIPFIACRGISDYAGRSAGGEYRRYLHLASHNAAVFTVAMVMKLNDPVK